MEDLRRKLFDEKEEALVKLKDFLVGHRKKAGFKSRRKITNPINRILKNISESIVYNNISEIERGNLIDDKNTGMKKEVYDAYFDILNLGDKEKQEYEGLIKLASIDVNSILEKENLKIKKEKEERWEREKSIEKEYGKSIEDTIKIFPEYVLQLTPTEYIESQGEYLTNYDFRTIDSKDNGGNDIWHKNHKFSNYDGALTRAKRDLVVKGKELEARIIVNLKSDVGRDWAHLIGTAMIPKKK